MMKTRLFNTAILLFLSISILVSCKKGPKANFTFTKSLLVVKFENSSTGGITQRWDFGDGDYSYDANPTKRYVKAEPICR